MEDDGGERVGDCAAKEEAVSDNRLNACIDNSSEA